MIHYLAFILHCGRCDVDEQQRGSESNIVFEVISSVGDLPSNRLDAIFSQN